jgi:hypothetical protein
VEDANLKRAREDLQSRIDILRKQAEVSTRYLNFFFVSRVSIVTKLSCFYVLEL